MGLLSSSINCLCVFLLESSGSCRFGVCESTGLVCGFKSTRWGLHPLRIHFCVSALHQNSADNGPSK